MKTRYHPDHPHHKVFKEYVAGRFASPDNPPVVQGRLKGFTDWQDMMPLWNIDWEYRIKPRTVTRTVTYPAPLSVKPEYGQSFWSINYTGNARQLTWDGCTRDLTCFKNGLCFATQEDAQAFCDAILGEPVAVSTGSQDDATSL
jgi:hypothetical protein